MPAGIITDTDVQLRIPGDIFRSVNPRNFSYPPITHERQATFFGDVSLVWAKVEGVPEPIDLLLSANDDPSDVDEAVAAFNADPVTAWSSLLDEFFAEQRRANASKRAILDSDEAFLADLEAGFLG